MRKYVVPFPRDASRRFQRRLIAWFRHHRRDLPWRRTRGAYRIWLAEVMLQQTRVAAVLPYYRRFVRRFPTVRALARTGVEEVLKHWAGLGYYSRARNLHRAAHEIVARHRGRFPRELHDALKLPGVGRYTAAAVLSIAYAKPLAVLDGNVARVLARLGAIRGDLRAPGRWRALEQTAQLMLATQSPGEWNQAMMELGATVCTPRTPHCSACPVSCCCRAYALGIVERLPSRRARRTPIRVQIAAAVLLDARGRTLLVRQDGRLFSRLWQFPAVEIQRSAVSELARHLRVSLGLRTSALEPLAPARHSVTYRDITLRPFLVPVQSLSGALMGRQTGGWQRVNSSTQVRGGAVDRRDANPEVQGTACSRAASRERRVRVMPLREINRLPTSSATRKIALAALRLTGRTPGVPARG